MKLALISDTHGLHDGLVVPNADVLVHAGDLTMRGSRRELEEAAAWLASLPHKHKVVVGGNHDWDLQRLLMADQESIIDSMFAGCHYLRDSSVNIEGFNFYGSPWQPFFCDWAFNLPRGSRLKEKWDMIPRRGLDVLITHGPPQGVLDSCPNGNVGCYDLRDAIRDAQPLIHVFGHIHESYGHEKVGMTDFYNASVVDGRYRRVNTPWVIDLDEARKVAA